MDRARFDSYLACFNRRDYAGLLDYWAEDCEVHFGGHVFRGTDQFIGFYRFFHAYVAESISVDAFLSDAAHVFLEARVRLEARRDLTPAILADAGYAGLLPMQAGQIVEMPQFIHYRLREGRFTKVVCVVSEAVS